MVQLMRLARSPFPLPLDSLQAHRSLLVVENLLSAVETMLAAPETLQRALIVADQQALVAEMIGARSPSARKSRDAIGVPVSARDGEDHQFNQQVV
jgi:UDP-glucose 4-epimerase